jgi:hypothetical protein
VTIARRQPEAADLREIIAVIRISVDLELVGNRAKSIAKRVINCSPGLWVPRCAIGSRCWKNPMVERPRGRGKRRLVVFWPLIKLDPILSLPRRAIH